MTRFFFCFVILAWFVFGCSVAIGDTGGKKQRGDDVKRIEDSAYVDTVAACLILEAGGEGAYGMQQVMSVIKNRAKKSQNPEDWFNVVIKPKQFSCFNGGIDNAVRIAKNHPRFIHALTIVKQANTTYKTDHTNGATHYHVWKGDNKVTPYWTHPDYGGKNKKAVVTAVVGAHVFLKNVD